MPDQPPCPEHYRVVRVDSREWYAQEVATGETGAKLPTRRLAVAAAHRRNQQRASLLFLGAETYYQNQRNRLTVPSEINSHA